MATSSTGTPASAAVEDPVEPQEVTLIEEGDVKLVLQNGTRVRVSSVVLSLASPVFKKMLGPHYLEGQAPRSAEQPKEVQLPDDDPNAMGKMLALLHFHDADTRIAVISPAELANLAVAVDKYDCVTALALTTEALLKRCTEPGAVPLLYVQTLPYYARLATAAFLLRNKNLFVKYTRLLVVECAGSCLDITDIEECKPLPDNVITS
ncbi:hypothetical protein LTR17_012979 [Elasticomyces elasticus]|nr:hypothetical protein LTR17_012979 [Elasticomyces elasticus]